MPALARWTLRQTKINTAEGTCLSFLASQCGDDPEQGGCLVLLLPRLADVRYLVLTMMKLQIKLD